MLPANMRCAALTRFYSEKISSIYVDLYRKSQNICRCISCSCPELLFFSGCHTLPILRRSQSKQTDEVVFPACCESRSACGRTRLEVGTKGH